METLSITAHLLQASGAHLDVTRRAGIVFELAE